MLTNSAILNVVLGVSAPWDVTKFHVNHNLNRIEIWIDQQTVVPKAQRAWFGLKKQVVKQAASTATGYTQWRHLNLAGWPIYVHSPAPTPATLVHMPWTGDPGQHFSHGMSRLIFTMMGEGASLATICAALQINLTDLWKYKLALDKGQVGVQANGINAARNSATQHTLAAIATVGSVVPNLDDSVWQALAAGAMEIEIKTLSLRLLLTRVKSQYQMAADDEVRTLGIRELHRFFEKNQRALSHELAQIMQRK
jgi:hypothetical protein